MKKTLKFMSFLVAAFCALIVGGKVANAANFNIDVINGQDGSGIEYGTITTTKNSCTVTEADAGMRLTITVGSGQQRYIEVNEGCTQTFKVTVNPGYEIESVLLDRQYVEISKDGTYTFNNVTADRALCIKYKKAGAPTSPNTGDVAYVLPLSLVSLMSLGFIIAIARKKHSLNA